MKNVLPYLILLLISCFSISTYAQSNDEPEALGLPGDNLNLYAVLDVFQKSKIFCFFNGIAPFCLHAWSY